MVKTSLCSIDPKRPAWKIPVHFFYTLHDYFLRPLEDCYPILYVLSHVLRISRIISDLQFHLFNLCMYERGYQYVNMNLSDISQVQINSNYLQSGKIKIIAFCNEIDEDRFTYVTWCNICQGTLLTKNVTP